MQVRFLLGPAGSGKTFRCLAEIRDALLASPDGPPLIFLAPKQATFQLERQLLADPSLAGYTRLRILSFERLAEFVFSHLNQPVPELLAEEGRVMVLRALLTRKKGELRLFRASARLPGFAQQLSRLLRELQQHQLTPAKLNSITARIEPSSKLAAKLHDLALMLHAYLDWLRDHDLEDADQLLDLAAALLKSQIANRKSQMLEGFWLDGFAQMTPQELDLLAALAPHCRRATLAFCLETEPQGAGTWLSMWSLIGQTFQRCRERLQTVVPQSAVAVEVLPRDESKSRFSGNPVVQHLERHWAQPRSFQGSESAGIPAGPSRPVVLAGKDAGAPGSHGQGFIVDSTATEQTGRLEACPTLAACANPEGEAVFAAREILRYVRDGGGRFRDCAVLLRSFEGYAHVLRRIFSRYEIPFFLDRRESVAHHPLAELTRYALRTVAFGWQHDDWFGALKTGLAGADEAEIDRLENEALARGWRGHDWWQEIHIAGEEELSAWLERVRQKIAPPFHRLSQALLLPLPPRHEWKEDQGAGTTHEDDSPSHEPSVRTVAFRPLQGSTPESARKQPECCGPHGFRFMGGEHGPESKEAIHEPDSTTDYAERSASPSAESAKSVVKELVQEVNAIQSTFSFLDSTVPDGREPTSSPLRGGKLEAGADDTPVLRTSGGLTDTSASQGKSGPTGAELAGALREFWSELKAGTTLERWTAENAGRSPVAHHQAPIHETVWVQMNEWLRNLERAFQDEPLPLNEWLPVVEAGLSNLSVGAIPPALDQVVIGTVDRSRNPDLRFAAVLGMNEGVFPAPPPPPALLSESDRATLASFGAALGPDRYEQISVERFYAYIACTRARGKLVLTYAKQDADNASLVPSAFVDHLKKLFPGLQPVIPQLSWGERAREPVPIDERLGGSLASPGLTEGLPPPEELSGTFAWNEVVHAGEVVAPMLKLQAGSPEAASAASWLERFPFLREVLAKWRNTTAALALSHLSPGLAERMYGAELRTSVSALEDFAACPFKYFAARGLRAEERSEFEADHREKGSFQHDVLREFHARVQAEGKRWRDLAPDEAREFIRRIGKELLPRYREGLFLASPSRRFTGEVLVESLGKLAGLLVAWAQQYQFDPQAAEVSFGLKEGPLPAWRINLDGGHALLLRGRIDRVDLCRIPETDETLGVVIDYKSSARELDATLLHHGLELQLLAYLGALAELDEAGAEFKAAAHVRPAGAFYVALRASGSSAPTRDEEQGQRERVRREGYQHRGRFDAAFLHRFDQSGQTSGDQFKYAKKKDGALRKRRNDALPTEEFQALVARIKEFLRRHGQAIYAGRVEVAPYRWRNETACDFCAYRSVCRFDAWTQSFRVLRPPPRPDRNNSAKP